MVMKVKFLVFKISRSGQFLTLGKLECPDNYQFCSEGYRGLKLILLKRFLHGYNIFFSFSPFASLTFSVNTNTYHTFQKSENYYVQTPAVVISNRSAYSQKVH